MSATAADPMSGATEEARGEGRAPPLPVERHLVPAVRALEALKGQADVLLLMLEHMPGEAAQIAQAVSALAGHGNAAVAAIDRFSEIRACRGQA